MAQPNPIAISTDPTHEIDKDYGCVLGDVPGETPDPTPENQEISVHYTSFG